MAFLPPPINQSARSGLHLPPPPQMVDTVQSPRFTNDSSHHYQQTIAGPSVTHNQYPATIPASAHPVPPPYSSDAYTQDTRCFDASYSSTRSYAPISSDYNHQYERTSKNDRYLRESSQSSSLGNGHAYSSSGHYEPYHTYSHHQQSSGYRSYSQPPYELPKPYGAQTYQPTANQAADTPNQSSNGYDQQSVSYYDDHYTQHRHPSYRSRLEDPPFSNLRPILPAPIPSSTSVYRNASTYGSPPPTESQRALPPLLPSSYTGAAAPVVLARPPVTYPDLMNSNHSVAPQFESESTSTPKKRGRPPKQFENIHELLDRATAAAAVTSSTDPKSKKGRLDSVRSELDCDNQSSEGLDRMQSEYSLQESALGYQTSPVVSNDNVATTSQIPSSKRVAIGDDLDALTLSVSVPLVPLKHVPFSALVAVPKDLALSKSDELSLSVPTIEDAVPESAHENSDSDSTTESQKDLVILDRALVLAQHRRLGLSESLELLTVTEFIEEFGPDLGISDFATSLIEVENMLYNMRDSFVKVLSAYRGFLRFIYPKARFIDDEVLTEIPAHLSHHFACSMTAAGIVSPVAVDATFLCKIFSQIDFVSIPAPFHVSAMSSLVLSVQSSKKFHLLVQAALEQKESFRRDRYLTLAMVKDLRAQVKNAELEVASLNAAIADLEGRKETSQGPGLIDIQNSITRNSVQSNTVNARLTQLLNELKDAETKDAEMKRLMESKDKRIRGRTKIIGYDRNGSYYMWVTLGDSNLEIAPAESSESADGEKSVGGLTSDILPIGGIIVDHSMVDIHTDKPGDNDSLPPTYSLVEDVYMLKSFCSSLNHRGSRERDLLSSLRDLFLPNGLSIPHPTEQNLKKKWEAFLAAELSPQELQLNIGLRKFCEWVFSRGTELPPCDVRGDTEISSGHEQLKTTRSSKMKRSQSVTSSEGAFLSEWDRRCLDEAKSRLRQLSVIQGTKPASNPTKHEKLKIENITALSDAIDMANTFIGRKYGKETISELERRLEACESIPMFCVLLADLMRETQSKGLNAWIEDTKDGGWVEEVEETTEADDLAKGITVGRKRLTRKPRKISKKSDKDSDVYMPK